MEIFGTPHCKVKLVDAFETTFGNPHPRLVIGENCESAEVFITRHVNVWKDMMEANGTPLTENTVLFAEIFELVLD